MCHVSPQSLTPIPNPCLPNPPPLISNPPMIMHDIAFAHKGFFFLFLLIPAMVAWYIRRQNRNPVNIKLSSFIGFRNNRKSYKNYLKHIPFIFRTLAFALIVVILARPQSSASGTNVTSEGIDIILVLDVSGSMIAEDFSPNRVGAAKQVDRKSTR